MTDYFTIEHIHSARAPVIGLIAIGLVACTGGASARPIFTTAPSHLQGVVIDTSKKNNAVTPVKKTRAKLDKKQISSKVPRSGRKTGNKHKAERPGATVRHLTNNIQGFRFSGEVSALEWPVYFTKAQSQGSLKFKVGYLSAVSVMPEASRLKLVVNDTIIGIANIHPTRGSRTIEFDIPRGIISPGFNSVRLTAEQRHRVDCSISATYELWTQIDPTRTGFVLPASDPGVRRLSELPALPPDSQGALPIRIVGLARTTTSEMERTIRAVQHVVLLGRFEQPVVKVGPLARGRYGINLIVGTINRIAPIARRLNIGAVAGPRVILLPGRDGLRPSIVVTGRTEEDIEFALLQITADKKLSGSVAGLRAVNAYPGYRIKGGERVKLRDMGMASEEFSGRLYKAAFNVIMPADFYSADYGKAHLDLAGGYASGLTNASQIIVSVNGRNAVSMKLPKSDGDVFKNSPIPLQLGHLRPGLNRIEIQAQVPAPEDKACDPLAVIGGRNRFLLLDSTELVLPKIARIARSPDLAVTTTGGFPFTTKDARPILFVPDADPHAISASATIAAHLSMAAGKVIKFRFTTKRPRNGSGATLVIAPHANLETKLITALGLSPEKLHAMWKGRVSEKPETRDVSELTRWERITRERLILQRNFPAACHMRRPPGGFKSALMTDMTPVASVDGNNGGKRDLFEEWDKRIRSQSKIMGYFSGFIKGVSDWAQGKISVARLWIGSQIDADTEKNMFTQNASLIVAQNIIGSSSNNIWTLFTAPNTGLLSQAVGCLVDPRVWQQINGRIVVLDASEAMVSSIPTTTSQFIPTQPLSVGNLRLIVAGWFSLNSKVYVLLAFLLALLLACSTHWFVRNSGRRHDL